MYPSLALADSLLQSPLYPWLHSPTYQLGDFARIGVGSGGGGNSILCWLLHYLIYQFCKFAETDLGGVEEGVYSCAARSSTVINLCQQIHLFLNAMFSCICLQKEFFVLISFD